MFFLSQVLTRSLVILSSLVTVSR